MSAVTLGVHHAAATVPDSAAIPDFFVDAFARRRAARGDVTSELPPGPLGDGGARHHPCLLPGGVRLEPIAA